MDDIELKIQKATSIIREANKKRNMKKSKKHNNRMLAIKKCSQQYINQFVNISNYQSKINTFIFQYNNFSGFNKPIGLSVKSIGVLTEDKIKFISDRGLIVKNDLIVFP